MAELLSGIFRREAWEHYTTVGEEGALLRLAPVWLRATFWVVAASFATVILVFLVATVDDYADAPAFVRLEDREPVVARAQGVVQRVAVSPGEHVAGGQLLLSLHAMEEAAERDRVEREWEAQLARRLADPSDEAARQALFTLRPQLALAEARLTARELRSPRAGVVTDIRVRPGQAVAPGDIVLALTAGSSSASLIILLPGQVRPRVSPGQPARVELQGFPYRYQDLHIDALDDELVGPAEMKRYLGPDLADVVPLAGALLVARIYLPRPTFEAEGRQFNYFDGMVGKVHVRLATRSVLLSLFPFLRALTSRP
jgi:multidrug resistance efflux pump